MTINSRQKGARLVDMSKEIWKPVVGYEGMYEVSNYGRIKSMPKKTYKSIRILHPYINIVHGYVEVSLYKDGKAKMHRVHKLVMEAFTDYRSMGTASGIGIDHIDGNKTNNRLDNLQVMSNADNLRKAHYITGINYKGTKCIDLTTGVVYKTFQDASRAIGGRRGEMVRRVCDGQRSHYRNHKFARYEDYLNDSIPEYTGKVKKKASVSLWR